MEKDKEKWMNDVLDSVQGSRRAKPHPELFAKIEAAVYAPQSKVIPIRQWRLFAAAAVCLLMLNIFALRKYAQSNVSAKEWLVENSVEETIISTYQLYE